MNKNYEKAYKERVCHEFMTHPLHKMLLNFSQ